VLLTDSVKDGAACIDGSPPAYYFRAGYGDGINKWQLHHEGGGWCVSLSDCLSKTKVGHGSSKDYPKTLVLSEGYFSTNQTLNPLMYNWNLAYFSYCDGSSFSGNNLTVTNYKGVDLYFRGFLNLKAYHSDLIKNKNLNSGTDFIISGCSAGGLATYLHVDFWADILPKGSKVRGMPDSGFFLDYDSEGKPKFATQMRWIFDQMNATSGVNQACIAAHTPTHDTSACFFAEHTAPYITTPLFPVQSEYDAWQASNILGSTDAVLLNNYGKMLTSRFKTGVLAHTANGCDLDSCFHHCHEWGQIVIGGYDQGKAVQAWYEGKELVLIQDKVYPCTECCVP